MTPINLLQNKNTSNILHLNCYLKIYIIALSCYGGTRNFHSCLESVKREKKKNMNSKQTSESNDLSCFEMYYRNINLGKYVWLNSGMLPGAEASRLVQSLTVWSAWGLGAPGSSFYAGQGQNWYPRSGFTWTLISWCFSGVPEVLRSCTGTGSCYC